jgi:hypothetical protein
MSDAKQPGFVGRQVLLDGPDNPRSVFLGRVDDQSWRLRFTDVDGIETRIALSDDAMHALINLFEGEIAHPAKTSSDIYLAHNAGGWDVISDV